MGTRKEDLTGQVDGSTDVFTTAYEYQPGTLMIGYNGQVYPVNFNIQNELTPTTFQLDFIPTSDTHSLHVIYEDKLGDGTIPPERMVGRGRPPPYC